MIWLRLCDEKLGVLSERGQAIELFLLIQRIRPLPGRSNPGHVLTPESHGLGADYRATFMRDLDAVLSQTGMAE